MKLFKRKSKKVEVTCIWRACGHNNNGKCMCNKISLVDATPLTYDTLEERDNKLKCAMFEWEV